MDVIAKLNKLRLERNLSVYRLSEITGITQSTLANTFSRGTIPSIQTLEALCSAMGITLSQFFKDDDNFIIMNKNDIAFFEEYSKMAKELKDSLYQLVKSINKNNMY